MSDGLIPAQHAAATGRRLRMWRPSSAGPNASTLSSLPLIRARARDQARNNPYAATALDKLVSNGIGTGIQAKGQWGDEAFRTRERALWARWMAASDADGVCDLYGLQALAWRERSEAGEVFVRLRSGRLSDGLPMPRHAAVTEAETGPQKCSGADNGGRRRPLPAAEKRARQSPHARSPATMDFSLRQSRANVRPCCN